MKVIVGLGNIGNKYKGTRHNAGFIALEKIKSELEKTGQTIEWKEEKKLKAIIAKTTHKGETLLLAKPTTFMNLSGEATVKILNFFKESTENLVVIYDDIDLPLGKIRIRDKGSAGTHNGMKSIIQQLGTQEFKRIRIGIESRGVHTPSQQDIHSFVLSQFLNNELAHLKEALTETIKEILN